MSISSLSIKKPVLAGVFSLLIVILGIVGWKQLGIREFPLTEPPVISVITFYPGASPDVIASKITRPMEESIAEASGIRTISSESREQVSVISIEFNREMDIENALNDVRDKVSKAKKQLPADVDPPIVQKASSADNLVAFLEVESDTKDIKEVSHIASTVIKDRVQSIPGINNVAIVGEHKYAMRLRFDPVKLAAYKLTPEDIRQALLRENVDLPSGRIDGNTSELSLRTLGRLTTVTDFEEMLIKQTGNSVIRLKDVGSAELGEMNERTAIINETGNLNRVGVGVAIQIQRGANAIEVVDEFYKRLEQLRKDIPSEYRLIVGFDFTQSVRESIKEVEETLFIAFGLVVIIIFLFLRDWRSTIIPVIAIPVSILSAFFIMYIAGFSINVLTLLGLVLAIGLVVDDAIVVLENIYKKIEEGMPPIQAAFKGSKEIYFAVISTTITLAAVFLPIVFMGGISGQLFKEFAIVVSGSVLISSFVALTLTPMLSAYFLKKKEGPGWFHRVTEPFFVRMNNGYARLLTTFMRFRWMAWIFLIITTVLIYFVGKKLPSELAPIEDRSNMNLIAVAPEGVSFDYMKKHMMEVGKYVNDSTDGLYQTYSMVAISFIPAPAPVNVAVQSIYLKDPKERKASIQDLYNQYGAASANFRGFLLFPYLPPTIGTRYGGGMPVQFVLQAQDLNTLTTALPKFLNAVRQSKKLMFADSDLKINKPEIKINIDRQKAALMGVSIEEVARTLQLSLSGLRYAYFLRNDRQYEVIGQMNRDLRNDITDLNSIYVRSNIGQLIPLNNLITTEEAVSPAAIYRYDQYTSATVSAAPAPGVSLAEGIEEIERIKKDVLGENFKTSLAGQSRDYRESQGNITFTLILALVIIYMILAAQFESLRDPLTIMLTVPMAVTGAILSLHWFGQSLNVFSQIGIITLVGLITKNGILIVEFANHLKDTGLSKYDAAIQAAEQRFRPILMTSLAMIFGALPIALTANSRQSLGIVIAGGLVFSGILTLFIIPAVYSYLSSNKRRKEVIEMDDHEIATNHE
ncbi:efflux RND transporter permease subunit [Elizabethkingia anophelis]|uniref:efflux RND transporter permease subunit n=1 Tax=Elizabethkingia anophelis TaxID=1117645 RepID=UPI001625FC00|nr:efflux RND transporter permease subunit [Elizabethkingia anophelis]MCT3629696.1 efflux RND transporter permease subunit [Elizabethkingia anophelis]MCT3633362.1 efflux RND transporter permease subunit [Elizabethkingia anophelis]MCT3829940.1 efflux RND transporter permease subunit [Elizabethkingia anophelis]MCT3883567.1 efflux RND transporter permease subunit [Elizabethkingia anophelis]MCT3894335.1 efflux RND transporter permease subunit [Elizabethkingia anophelis]